MVGGRSHVNSAPRVTDDEWRSLVASARRLAEQVARLSGRLAVIEQCLSGPDRQASAPPRSSDR